MPLFLARESAVCSTFLSLHCMRLLVPPCLCPPQDVTRVAATNIIRKYLPQPDTSYFFICLISKQAVLKIRKACLSTGFFVRKTRLELVQENSHYPLKVARLPFRHFRVGNAKLYNNGEFAKKVLIIDDKLSYYRLHQFLGFFCCGHQRKTQLIAAQLHRS